MIKNSFLWLANYYFAHDSSGVGRSHRVGHNWGTSSYGQGSDERSWNRRFRPSLGIESEGGDTTAYSFPGVALHGLMTAMPAARKGASSRVAILNRRDAAMAAIWASATAIE